MQQSNNGSSLDYKHLAEVVQMNNTLEFLKEILPRKITVRQFKEMMAAKNSSHSSSSGSSSDSDSESESDSDSDTDSTVETEKKEKSGSESKASNEAENENSQSERSELSGKSDSEGDSKR